MVLRRRPEKSDDSDRDDNKSVEASVMKLEARMDALDSRLDNIDSMVTAVAERIMSRPLIINATCPNCGKNMEIAVIGTSKPTK